MDTLPCTVSTLLCANTPQKQAWQGGNAFPIEGLHSKIAQIWR